MKYFCNPLNFEYNYQFNKNRDGSISVSREAADPSMVMFKGMYYIFPSMTCGFLYSSDMAEWKFHPLRNLPGYDYAPDICVIGDYVCLSASNHDYGRFYRTKDLFSDDFEVIEGAFPFWDPHLFTDDDGRMYFYWGCGAGVPIYGIELDPVTFQPLGEKKDLIFPDDTWKGFERRGENHAHQKPGQAEIEAMVEKLKENNVPEDLRKSALGMMIGEPFNEGPWMTKHNGKYYLQYATPGAQFNVYSDAVYISTSPLGDFILAENNPFSYKPGGFISGAGHGSTMQDTKSRYWHTATMRISLNHIFERRIGLWPAGFDEDGELFCDQRYGDFPYRIDQKPWENPDFMLLSYGKKVRASSWVDGKSAENAVDENIQTWWRASSNNSNEWIEIDLNKVFDVRAIQVNFADDGLDVSLPCGIELAGSEHLPRWIDETHQPTRWLLEGSIDGETYFVITDKSKTETDLPHDFIAVENGIEARYLKLTVISLPYNQAACISGLRVFGKGSGTLPNPATNIKLVRQSEIDLSVTWDGDAVGYVVLWGHKPDRLYHSYQVFNKEVKIGGLVKGQDVYVCVESFNENGITAGVIHAV